ncbi:MAG: class I SAM-dependent methyltransferase, partial [Phycisphaerae bacterium]|nr:class I SAM-dependent methyltransferase [Phycisphaerae bacterium]
RIYRLTRHVYDATRKFFLLGRDTLLDAVPADATRVVEVGCGTARNLVLLARRRPGASLFGLDASAEMLRTASRQVARAGVADRVTLRHALAEDLRPALFGLDAPLDAALFPYSLSMMPGWRAALDAAIASVRPGGAILIVDFWDQAAWPGPLRRLLVWWLGLFSVRFRPELLEHLRHLEGGGAVRLDVRGIGGRYAYIARLTRA